MPLGLACGKGRGSCLFLRIVSRKPVRAHGDPVERPVDKPVDSPVDFSVDNLESRSRPIPFRECWQKVHEQEMSDRPTPAQLRCAYCFT